MGIRGFLLLAGGIGLFAFGLLKGESSQERLARLTEEADRAEYEADRAEAALERGMAQRAKFGEAGRRPKMSLSEFHAVRLGDSIKDVQSEVGSAGNLSSENQVGDLHTVAITWAGEGKIGANALLTFQNGFLVQKSQTGLQ